MIDVSKLQLTANNTFLSCGGADKVIIEILDGWLTITVEGDNNEQNHREIKNFFIDIEREFDVPILNVDLYNVSAKNNNLIITMPLKKTQNMANEIVRSGMSFFLTENTQIIYGGVGRSKSYSPFFIKHNLMGKSEEELRERLNEIIADKSLDENEISKAKTILNNLENTTEK